MSEPTTMSSRGNPPRAKRSLVNPKQLYFNSLQKMLQGLLGNDVEPRHLQALMKNARFVFGHEHSSLADKVLMNRRLSVHLKLRLAVELKKLGLEAGSDMAERINAVLAGEAIDRFSELSVKTRILIKEFLHREKQLKELAQDIAKAAKVPTSMQDMMAEVLMRPELLLAAESSTEEDKEEIEKAVAPQVLVNYMGNGDPRLKLTLADNGAGWGSYTIPYQSFGNVPYSSNSSKQWSAWDIYDDDGNYYGTLNLNSDGKTITQGNPVYVKPTEGEHYIEGFSLTQGKDGYEARVDKVFSPAPPQDQLKIKNNIGDGKLYMDLSANQAGWESYELNPGAEGNVPLGWSSWPVHDGPNQTGNYYGTVSLYNDGTKISFGDPAYSPSDTGYTLDPNSLSLTQAPDGSYQVNATATLSPGPFPNTPPAVPPKDAAGNPVVLSVEGGNIVCNGEAVTLVGQNVESMEWTIQGASFIGPEFIEYMAQFWEGNHIRIPLNQASWLASEDASVIGSYKQIINAMVAEASKRGMAVSLDLHWLDDTVQQAPMTNDDSVKFWTDVANSYKDFGNVMFELYNEPYGVSKDEWHKRYDELIKAVRKTGAENIVMVAGLDYGYDLSHVNEEKGQYCFDDKNLIYVCHPYVTPGMAYDKGKGMPGYEGPGGDFATSLGGITRSPIIFTEFGNSNPAHYPPVPVDPDVPPSNTQYEYAINYYLEYAKQMGIHLTGFAAMPDAYDVANKPFYPQLVDTKGQPLFSGVELYQFIQENPVAKLFPPQAQVLSAQAKAIKAQGFLASREAVQPREDDNQGPGPGKGAIRTATCA